MRRCPDPKKAKQLGCLNLKEDGQCVRLVWKERAYTDKTPSDKSGLIVYCERLGTTVREN